MSKELPPGEVHVWQADLDALHSRNAWTAYLSPDERERAANFHFDKDRDRFTAGRGVLRVLLGEYTQQAPETLHFHYNESGKPALASVPDVHFNLSHSRNHALFAFTLTGNIGIDIEYVRTDWNAHYLARMAGRFFHPREAETLHQLPETTRREWFFQIWTRKEALIKARGMGLWKGLDVDISNAGEIPVGWWIVDLETPAGFAGALATQNRTQKIQRFQFELGNRV